MDFAILKWSDPGSKETELIPLVVNSRIFNTIQVARIVWSKVKYLSL